jgi:ribosome-associated protein
MPKNKPQNLRVVELEHLPIELYKLLKFENLVQSGGEAKLFISEGHVRVNGEVETQKGKKIFAGDIISFAAETMEIVQAKGN